MSRFITARVSPECPHPFLPSFTINSSFCAPSASEAMETSASRAAEKKDKMDGSSFGDLPKKPSPSETRGNALSETFSQAACWIRCPVESVSRGLTGPEPGGKGAPRRAMKYTFQRRHLGLIRQQQSEVTYSRCLIGILDAAAPWKSIGNERRPGVELSSVNADEQITWQERRAGENQCLCCWTKWGVAPSQCMF